MRRTTRACVALMCGALFGGVVSAPAFAENDTTTGSLAADAVGAVKSTADPDPASPTEIATANAESAAKDRRLGLLSAGTQAALPTSAHLAANHVVQAHSNYCGPAAARMTLLHQGKNVSQAKLAKRFGISPGNGGTNRPDLVSALRHYGAKGYTDQTLPYTPTAAQKRKYKSRLRSNIAKGKDSIVGNVYEVPGGPHLPGHPNREILHYVNIRGYKKKGARSLVQDPASSVWSGVPEQSNISSNSLVTMMGGRGYVW